MNGLSRRQLLKYGVTGVAGAIAAPYIVPSGVLAADGKPGTNERITIGAIGVGGRASLLLDQLPKDAQIVALCDCNLPRAEGFRNRKKHLGRCASTIKNSWNAKTSMQLSSARPSFSGYYPAFTPARRGRTSTPKSRSP